MDTKNIIIILVAIIIIVLLIININKENLTISGINHNTGDAIHHIINDDKTHIIQHELSKLDLEDKKKVINNIINKANIIDNSINKDEINKKIKEVNIKDVSKLIQNNLPIEILNNKQDNIDDNYVSPYTVSYSSFYYDHNKDPYKEVFTNKEWLYDPWNINVKYV